ncbi:enoyl-CoA hydratase-related protein [Niabella ginsengisoli]|uniref:Enoyl-CoA hydratase-related protein n=1 Tax=Niabella ginsengisoli TaxID=522298 RepID=A0ABS9SKY9_9BACT|nr:enoyl-CoA hydratase-related protein [Niabella ginsengisoli]MCH5599047.1 enoyl-CoA hydratase-related protein [Niabella ginsengisoli]
MNQFTTLEIETSYNICTIWLNRPDVRNAFNDVMINELIAAFKQEGLRTNVRAIVLRGKGKVFCAGADLNWMRDTAKYSYDQNYEESMLLAECFRTIYKCPKPTLAIVHGAAMGGANGLLAACDFAFCEADTSFSFSEVKIGIVPATIAPYIIKRIGEYPSRQLMLTGQRIKGSDAETLRLVNKCFKDIHETEAHLQATIQLLLTSAPKAISLCKEMIARIVNELSEEEIPDYTAKMITETRASEEGQEGMAAFLEKRKPNWIE